MQTGAEGDVVTVSGVGQDRRPRDLPAGGLLAEAGGSSGFVWKATSSGIFGLRLRGRSSHHPSGR